MKGEVLWKQAGLSRIDNDIFREISIYSDPQGSTAFSTILITLLGTFTVLTFPAPPIGEPTEDTVANFEVMDLRAEHSDCPSPLVRGGARKLCFEDSSNDHAISMA